MAFRARAFRGLLATFTALSFALASACTEEAIDPRPEEIDSYVGAIADTDAVFAVTATELEVVLYVCGGPSSLERHSRWYRGQRGIGDTVELSAVDGSTAVLRFTSTVDGGEGVAGEVVEPDGTRLELEAGLSAPDSVAGLYGALDAGCRTGVVVQQSSAGEEPVVQGTWCSEEGIYAQVTPIAPLESDASGFEVEVTATRLVPTRQLLVRSINPAAF